MASSKLMASSNSRNSDPPRRFSSSSSKKQPQSITDHIKTSNSDHNRLTNRTYSNLAASMTVDGLLRNVYDSHTAAESTLLDAQISLVDTPNPSSFSSTSTSAAATTATSAPIDNSTNTSFSTALRTVDDVWRDIVSGEGKELKEEAPEMMTLEDFLTKAGAVEDVDVKVPLQTESLNGGVFAFDLMPQSPFQAVEEVEREIIGFGNGAEAIGSGGGEGGRGRGRGKRGAVALEPLDKAAQQRQKRMIKNRESAARSRERKQAYQVELESLSVRLEEENALLTREKDERTKERYKQLMEKVIPVVEKRRPLHSLRRVHSLEW